ncbi:ribonuclease HII [Sporohalobacter salinus]|uniref:ribonuclease HII n=1 Tax=Sporohalobacter salinus TaxID=1494606 RepID=UPI001EF9AADA|nr:ribonuclease HII [Sporohalobacter salinus]MBM7623538.1 ribonuclease HII [Sporohalobacter salinus]
MQLEEMTIKEIKSELKSMELKAISDELIAELIADSRKGVRQLAKRCERRKKRAAKKRKKFYKMKRFEDDLVNRGYRLIGGVDEAGRGPLAGPVVASVVILPKDIFMPGLNDSKQLSEEKREEFFAELQKEALDIGVGIVDSDCIDDINIRNANYQAMRKAILNLDKTPDYLLVDGEEIPEIEIRQQKIVDGDARSISIAAASIIAKVTRDRMLVEYDKEYPEYNFAQHKGYGTASHIDALEKYGPCSIHRYSFSKVREAALSKDYYLFEKGLKNAEAIDQLESIAVSVKECVDLLSEFELKELRNIFLQRKRELR